MNKFKKWLIPIAVICILLAVLVGSNCTTAIDNQGAEAPPLGEIFDPSGNPFAHRFTDVSDLRAATFIVSASDSEHKYEADYWCDGVADDEQINAALNALPASGGRVMLSEGTFNTVDSITIPANNITLRGQGRSTLIDGDGLGNNEHAIVINGVTNTVIKKLAIQTEDGGGKISHCIALSNGCNSFTIESVTIVDSDSNGIDISGTNILNGIIRDCSIESADEYGIYCSMTLGHFMLRLHVLDNFITGCGLDGMKLYHVDYGLIEGNVCYSNGNNGIYIVNTDYATLDDNMCILNTLQGIYLLGVDNSTVEDNLCHSNGGHSLYIGGTSSQNVVEGNQCIAANSATSDGIEVDPNCHENSITGNGCIGNGRYGIYIGGARNEVIGNHVETSAQHGIYVTADCCKVNNNYCYDNGQDTAGTYHGIMLSANADRCSIVGNYCNSPGDSQEDGIYLADGAVECNINSNYCYNGMGDGIHLAGNNLDCQIVGNQCNQCDDHGILIEDESDRIVVTGNKCFQNGGTGILISESDYCSVTGNTCNNNTGDGIHIAGSGTHNADYNSLTGNTCTGNTGAGIEISEAGAGQSNKNIVLGCQLLGNTTAALTDGGTGTVAEHNITA